MQGDAARRQARVRGDAEEQRPLCLKRGRDWRLELAILHQRVQRRLDGAVAPVRGGRGSAVDQTYGGPAIAGRCKDGRFRQLEGLRDGRAVQIQGQRRAVVVEPGACDGRRRLRCAYDVGRGAGRIGRRTSLSI